MKRFALLLFPVLLCIILIACDTTGENVSDASNQASTEISQTESSVNESTAESSVDESEQSSVESSSTPDESITESSKIREEFDVSVTIHGTTALGNAGFSVKSGYAKNQKITVEGDKDVIAALDISEITADVDVSGTSSVGKFEFLIIYSVPENVTVVSTSAEYLTLEIVEKSNESTNPPSDSAYISNGIIIVGNRGMEQFGGSAAGGE
jgi:hypothetical protein